MNGRPLYRAEPMEVSVRTMSKCVIGKTDLATINPDLADEWHQILNVNLKPSDITAHSNKKVWWHCKKCDHDWQATVNNRSNGNGCPYCFGRFPIPGKSDLATINPDLADEWHPTLNGDLRPSDVTINCRKKVWWRCKRGHEWQARIIDRNQRNSCPYCNKKRAIQGETDLETLNPDLADEWHPTLNGNLKPSDVKVNSDKKVWWHCKKCDHDWQARISRRSEGSGCPYCSGRLPISGKTDLATINSDLAGEWHPVLNGNLKSSEVTANCSRKVWWRCKKCGHGWQATVNNRSQGSGCPYCDRKLVKPGKTDLATINPNLADEWHPTLNGNLKPSDITAYSSKKVWWHCKKCDHDWQAIISARSRGNRCPYCAKKRVIKGETDLETLNPDLAGEWHPTLNGNLKPSDVTVNSSKKVWWKCKNNSHAWKALISNRNAGNGCPYCAEKRAKTREPGLITNRPNLKF